jgi:hypothetical protein
MVGGLIGIGSSAVLAYRVEEIRGEPSGRSRFTL